MKTATVREVQHHFNRVLKLTEGGEAVRITSRNRVVAQLTAIEEVEEAPNVDFHQRAKALWGEAAMNLSDAIIEDREERF